MKPLVAQLNPTSEMLAGINYLDISMVPPSIGKEWVEKHKFFFTSRSKGEDLNSF